MDHLALIAVNVLLAVTSINGCPSNTTTLRVMDGESGTLSYLDEEDRECGWQVQTEDRSVLEMTIVNMSMDDHTCGETGFCWCEKTYLDFIDTDGSIIFRTCGSEPASQIRSSGTTLSVKFVINKTNTAAGKTFTIAYNAQRPDQLAPISNCIRGRGYDYSGDEDVSQSGEPCLSWNVVIANTKHHETFVSEEQKFWPDLKQARRGAFCRNDVKRLITGPWCYIKAKNDDDRVFMEECNLSQCSCSKDRMNASLGGVLSSPGFPRGNPATRCRWHLTTFPDHSIQVTFHLILLKLLYLNDCPGENVQIHEKRDNKWYRKVRICGQPKVQPYVSETPELAIEFNSNRDTRAEKSGFNATYSVLHTPAPTTKCQTKSVKGTDYTGTVSHTASGLKCQAWNAQTPHEHESHNNLDRFPEKNLTKAADYCRNPSRNQGSVWCYTTSPGVRWEQCDVPYCVSKTSRGCQTRSLRGLDYVGRLSRTLAGHQCLPWNDWPRINEQMDKYTANFPEKSLTNARNWCRNPDLKRGVWCYYRYTNQWGWGWKVHWDFCNVSVCPEPESPGFVSRECKEDARGWSYRGMVNVTRSGRPCQPWTTFREQETDLRFPDGSAEAAENYCRNPDGDKGPWCWIRNGDRDTYDYCDIKLC